MREKLYKVEKSLKTKIYPGERSKTSKDGISCTLFFSAQNQHRYQGARSCCVRAFTTSNLCTPALNKRLVYESKGLLTPIMRWDKSSRLETITEFSFTERVQIFHENL